MDKLNLEQLKAHAYDCLANIENWKRELELTNQTIANYKQERADVGNTKEEEKVDKSK